VAAFTVLTTYMTESAKNSAPTTALICSRASAVRCATGCATASPTLRRHPCSPAVPIRVADAMVASCRW